LEIKPLPTKQLSINKKQSNYLKSRFMQMERLFYLTTSYISNIILLNPDFPRSYFFSIILLIACNYKLGCIFIG